MIETVLLAVTLFAATNVDDVFVLLGFFSDPKYRARNIVIGQYAGIILLVGVSVIASLVALVIPAQYVGLLGLAPIAIGIKALLSKRDDAEEHPEHAKVGGQILAVAAVTIANGGDNIGVYTPVFATEPPANVAIFVAVFVAMTAVWCFIGHWMVNHKNLDAPIKRYGPRIVPFVLIALGLFILYEAHSFDLLAG